MQVVVYLYSFSPPAAEIEARTVLWLLTFVGFAVNYMLRININITIVDMIRAGSGSSKNSANITKCFSSVIPTVTSLVNGSQENYLGSGEEDDDADSGFVLEKSFFRMFNIWYERNGFEWNEHERNLLLGSFYWLHWVTQIPGGILGRKYGTKVVFGVSNLIGCLLCVFMPIAAYLSFEWLMTLRIIQGLIVGLAWPSMHTMAGRWIPPNERSKFVTAYLGSSMGVAITFPLFGFVISWTSWEWVYHLCGIIGVLWFVAWWYFVYDSPAQHPRISLEERTYIEKSLGTSVQKDAGPIPWKAIMSSKAVWMIIIVQWGGIWGLFTLMIQAPTYLKLIHDLPIELTGILSGIPHLMRMLFAYAVSVFGDRMLRTNRMSRTNVRKLAGFVCAVLNGFFILGLAYSGCNTVAAIVFLTLGTMSHGAVSTGPLANIVDLSPNHAGVLLGLSGMVGVLPGFISPVIVGYLTNNNVRGRTRQL